MTNKRNLRIFCPTHEAAFEVAEGPKILCEITEHTLSVGFPNSEFWEFCCNCETFTPSRLDRGEKAREVCYGCDNEISKRFVCANCKIVGFECDAQTKGKSYSINANGIAPFCPGCQSAMQNGALIMHQCEEIKANVLTARTDCPFCLKKTDAGDGRTKAGTTANLYQVCPNCGTDKIPAAAIFCGKCRHQLRTDVAVANPGSENNRTRLLGSLCPNCSSPVPPDAEFCGQCGQAVKKAVPPPPPPPPKKVVPEQATVNAPVDSRPDNSMRGPLIGVGAVVVLIIIAIIASNTSKSSSSSYNSNSTSYGSNSSSTSSSSNSSSSTTVSLPYSFHREYEGTINGQDFSMTLDKSGRSLTGTASTSTNTDDLRGTIETDGRFRADGYESGAKMTGKYSGQIYADGSITGSWTTTRGTLETSFYLSQH